ncbi:hypothetical protein B0H16DRAFT_1571743 [Mycena metata]|uniref:Uncharacterized protein n=1 Tax=Mycena metata TaxID=1033252 RepID=A0AAD7I906_9AGAR|nr:hypothetical protein B0H16DRAFT_1607002 [Mycena metata]KAJ7737761.1 hypothetical protein B0H16DRAFT_1571743 [Mycena metata]
MSSLAEPVFSADIEREIFETTAFLYPQSIGRLLLVARRVLMWIDPLRYRVVSICGPDRDVRTDQLFRHSLDAFSNLYRAKPAMFHNHIRHLCFRDYQKVSDITSVLSACSFTTNLLLFFIGSPIHLPLLNAMPLRRLSVLLQLLFPSPAEKDFTLPLFANITHLDIFYYISEPWESWSKLAKIPHLSHLSIHDHYISNAICQGILKHCRSLQVLANVFTTRDTLRKQAPKRAPLAADPRFVMMLLSDFLGDWENGAHGGEDYWDRAEEYVRQRRSGETEDYMFDREG